MGSSGTRKKIVFAHPWVNVRSLYGLKDEAHTALLHKRQAWTLRCGHALCPSFKGPVPTPKVATKPRQNGQEPIVHSTPLRLLGASIRIQESYQERRPVSKARIQSKYNEKQYINSSQMHRVLPKDPNKQTVNCSL
ncbi:hypothetical protein PEX1_082520 [Penicillium expansum]|nr:hypothetical protein PEX1_082520 [Penicillium expansum]